MFLALKQISQNSKLPKNLKFCIVKSLTTSAKNTYYIENRH